MSARDLDEQRVGLGVIFTTFLEIALSSFGGALAWARRMLVERRGWLTDREFAELLGVCQVLPGGNVMNLTVCVGGHFRGPLGSAAALGGLLLAPVVLVVLLGMLHEQGAQLDAVRAALRGAATVTAGLVLGTGLKLALAYRAQPWALLLAALGLVGAGLLRLPLIPVLLVLAPCGIILAWRRAR